MYRWYRALTIDVHLGSMWEGASSVLPGTFRDAEGKGTEKEFAGLKRWKVTEISKMKDIKRI